MARNVKYRRNILLLAATAWICACGLDDRATQIAALSGAVMGTQYHITVVHDAAQDIQISPTEISGIFNTVSNQFSTYEESSDISAFNQFDSIEWFTTSIDFCHTLEDALAISKASSGAFDPTVGRLVNAWGFGPAAMRFEPPSQKQVAQALATSGYQKLHTECNANRIRKEHPDLYVDLSGYAKGLAVDLVADKLDALQIANYMVELGGEIRVRGTNPDGEAWRIAIENPLYLDNPGDDVRAGHAALRLTDVAVATSGDYRNFFEHDGVRYSHTIDSRTGHPVTHSTASVTVVNESAAYADAMATALLVMGQEKGLAFAETEAIAAYFLVRDGREFRNAASSAFATYLEVASK